MGPLGLVRGRRPDQSGAAIASVLTSVGLVVIFWCFVFQCGVGAFVIVEIKIARKSSKALGQVVVSFLRLRQIHAVACCSTAAFEG